MITYFRSGTTKAIHMVGDFPPPKSEGKSQCGKPLSLMRQMERREVRNAKDYEFCLKCTQLLGLYFYNHPR